MNDLSPDARKDYLDKLIENYNPELADAVIDCYLKGLNDEETDALLEEYGVRRIFSVKKASQIYKTQGDVRRTGESKRVWSEKQMKKHWKELCSLCLITGIPDSILDINWNRF